MDTKLSARIRSLIADNQTLTAIELLLSSIDEQRNRDDYDSLILLKSRYQRAKQQETLGIISFSDGLRDQTQVSYAVLHLLSSLDTRKNTGVNDKEPLKKETILFLSADSQGKYQLEKEFIQIGLGLQDDFVDSFRLVSAWAVTPDDFQMEVLKQKPQILHFSGHGEQAGIMLQDTTGTDKLVSASALIRFFKVFTKKFKINCVFLNTCYSAEQAEAISQYVAYVIGMSQNVDDNTAIQFSKAFYRTYAREKEIEFAFDLAVNSIEMNDLLDADVPVIYANGKKVVV
ncbi:MAG: CHAT domain-containing protein [Bacteroidia bacterium]